MLRPCLFYKEKGDGMSITMIVDEVVKLSSFRRLCKKAAGKAREYRGMKRIWGTLQ